MLFRSKPNKNGKCFGNKCQKHQNGHIFIFTNPNEVIQISLESPWKYLTGEINFVSKFHVFLKWLTKWKNIREHFDDSFKIIKMIFGVNPIGDAFICLGLSIPSLV